MAGITEQIEPTKDKVSSDVRAQTDEASKEIQTKKQTTDHARSGQPTDDTSRYMALYETAAQIGELTSEEKRLKSEFLASLKQIMRKLAIDVEVSTKILNKRGVMGGYPSEVKKCIMDSELILSMLFHDDSLCSKPLESLPSDSFLAIVSETIVKMQEAAERMSEDLTSRVDYFDKALGPLAKIDRAIGFETEEKPPEDIVAKSLEEDENT